MANLKQYAYFLKGRKIAIVENDITPENDPTSRDYGPDARVRRYKSPVETVTDGLEIEYTYSPHYWISNELSTNSNRFYVDGWTVIDGYLAFSKSALTSGINWTASPFNAVGSEEYIFVRNSDRWSGFHKIKSTGTTGVLQTYTRVHESMVSAEGSTNINVLAESGGWSNIRGVDGSDHYLGHTFSAGDFVIIDNTTAINTGLWKIDSVTTTSADQESESIIHLKDKYYHPSDIDVPNGITSKETQYIDTTPDTSAHSSSSVKIYKAVLDPCYIISDVNVMEDEDFDLDVSPYLAKAVVYYLKAKMAEDKRDFKSKEYFMKQFKELVEKKQSANIWGPRVIVPGSGSIR